MGGGEWQSKPQVQQLYKAYEQVAPQRVIKTKVVPEVQAVVETPCKPDLFAEVKVDWIDKIYVSARTGIPSWVIGGIFLVGLVVLVPVILNKKYGISLNTDNKGKK